MDRRGMERALDTVLGITITLMCVVGTFVLARYALFVVFQ
jgi:hypothetical protein